MQVRVITGKKMLKKIRKNDIYYKYIIKLKNIFFYGYTLYIDLYFK